MNFDDDISIANAYNNSKRIKKEKTIEQYAKYYWNNMNNRVGKGCYKDITIEWEYSDFEKWFINNKEIFDRIKSANKSPSIDRIDPRKNYSEQNCRIIPSDLNTALGKINGLQSQLKKLYSFVEENKHWITD